MDPRAARRQGHPLRGQLFELARAEAGAVGARGAQQRSAQAHTRPGTRVGADGPEGTPGQGQGPPRRLREALQREQGPSPRPVGARDHDPVGAPPRRPGDRGRAPQQGLRRSPPHRGPVVHPAAGGHRRHHRAERRRQVDPVQDAGRPRAARFGLDQDRRHRRPLVRRPGSRRPRSRRHRLRGDHRRRRGARGRRPRDPRPRVRVEFQLQGHRSRQARRRSVRR